MIEVIEVIVGSMFSGKSAKQTVQVFKPRSDIRCIETHEPTADRLKTCAPEMRT